MSAMDVELPDSAVGPKIKADDDPENEAAFMGLSVLRFRMASKKATAEAKKKDWAEFLPLVERFNAVAVYEAVCQETSTAVDGVLLAKMKAANKARLQEIDDAIKDAMENEGDMEVRDATMAKAQVLARTADKAAAITGYETAEALPKTTSGQKLDCRFHLMRVGMFWGDIPMVESHVTVLSLIHI